MVCRAEGWRLRMILLWWIVELLPLLRIVDWRLVGFKRIPSGHGERRRGLRNGGRVVPTILT